MHKKILLTLVFGCLLCLNSNAADTLQLSEAIRLKKISATITGNDPLPKGSTNNYGQCLKAKIKNLGNTAIVLLLNTGQMMKCADKNTQNMVITKSYRINLAAGKEIAQPLYAMCGEMGKLAPTPQISYTVGDPCSPALQNVVNEIEKINYQNMSGQLAVWCITDQNSLSAFTMDCKDKNAIKPIVRYICNAQKIPVPREYASGYVSQRLTISYTLKDSSKVKIIIYDQSGEEKLNLMNLTQRAPGTYNDSYWISEIDLVPGDYQYIIFINGSPVITEPFKF